MFRQDIEGFVDLLQLENDQKSTYSDCEFQVLIFRAIFRGGGGVELQRTNILINKRIFEYSFVLMTKHLIKFETQI